MKAIAVRIFATLSTLAVVAVLSAAGAKAVSKPAHVLEPDKLVILSTTDVKGKTSPCG